MSENRIIGRDYEQHILQNICEEEEARLIAVYGRRRVGKTYRTFWQLLPIFGTPGVQLATV